MSKKKYSNKAGNTGLIFGSVMVVVVLIGAAAIFGSRSHNRGTIPLHGTQSNPGAIERSVGQTARAQVPIDESDPVLGNADAPVTIVEFSDFQCTFCTRFFFQTEPIIKSTYIDTGKAKLVYKDLSVNGRESDFAAQAAQCAHDQGKFWEYHDLLFRKRTGYNDGTFTKDKLKQYGAELGLHAEKFNACVDKGEFASRVNGDETHARSVGANGTPTFFINGIRVVGAQPTNIFEQIIDAELARLGKNE